MAIVLPLPPPPPPPIPPSTHDDVTPIRRPRLWTVLTMPPEFVDWLIRCELGNIPTVQRMQAALADVDRRTWPVFYRPWMQEVQKK
jgi:hypothetical protein